MHSNNGIYTPSLDCTHETLFDDHVNGTTVCTQCGLVLEENNLFSDFNSLRSRFPSFSLGSYFSATVDDPSVTLIKDLLSRWLHIDEGMAEVIYNRFEKEKEKIKRKKKKNMLLAYIMYLELTNAGYSFMPAEIAQVFQLKTSDLFKFQSILSESSAKSAVSPSHSISAMSDKYCSLVGEISFKDKTKIGQICETLKTQCNTNHKSLCILVIWYYCTSAHPTVIHHTLCEIAKKCHCNYDNLRRLIKKPFWSSLEREIDKLI